MFSVLFPNDVEIPSPFEWRGTSHDLERVVVKIPEGGHLSVFPRNPIFTGRGEILKRIHEALIPNSQNIVEKDSKQRSVILYGMGGMGKTEAALEFCYAYESSFQAILWLNSTTSKSLNQSIKNAAARLGLLDEGGSHASAEAARTRILEQAPPSWLIVFDNVEVNQGLQDFWPRYASVIITSRDPNISHLPIVSIELVPLTENVATSLLLKILNRESYDEEETSAAAALATYLDGLPLAISTMANIIKRRGLNLSHFQSIYEKNRLSIFKQQASSRTYHHTLDTVWVRAFLSLSEDAEAFLSILSIIYPDSIELAVFTRTDYSLGAGLIADDLQLSKVLEELVSHALILRSKTNRIVSIHRLTQSMFRQHSPPERLAWAFGRAASCILQRLKIEAQRPSTFSEHGLINHMASLQECFAEYSSRYPLVDTIPELQELDAYISERSWLLKYCQPAPASASATVNSVGRNADGDVTEWASTTTLVRFTPDMSASITDQFVKLFSSDTGLLEAASTFADLVGRRVFDYICAGLLTVFIVHLQDEQPYCAEMFQELKAFAANSTDASVALQSALDQVRRGAKKDDGLNFQQLDVTLREINSPSASKPTSSYVASSDLVKNIEFADPLKSSVAEGSTVVDDATSFVLQSSALQILKTDLDAQIRKQRLKENRSGYPSSQGHGIPRELQGSISDFPGNQKPKRLREPTPVTVTWKCQCGTSITDTYMEYVEGSVQSFINDREMRSKNPSDNDRNMTKQALSKVVNSFFQSILHFVYQATPAAPGIADQNGGTSGSEIAFAESQQQTTNINGRRNLNLESDQKLYDILRTQYRALTARWKRKLSLRRISEIRFIRFRLRSNNIAIIDVHSGIPSHIRESLPPAGNEDYAYAPPEPTFLPPIGHNEMMHYFYRPCVGQNDDFHIRRFPGHRNNPVPFQLSEDEKYAWGIELVESREWMYLSLPVFLVILSSMVFGVVWTVVRSDIQGGFTVAGYVVTSGLSLLATIQVILEGT